MNFEDYDIIPVVRELSADAITPVAAFAALSNDGAEAFLLESVERGRTWGATPSSDSIRAAAFDLTRRRRSR